MPFFVVLRGPSRPFVEKRVLQLPFFVALSGPSRPFVDKRVLPLPFFAALRGQKGVVVAVLRGPSWPFAALRGQKGVAVAVHHGPSRPFANSPHSVHANPKPAKKGNRQQNYYQRPTAVRNGYNQPTPPTLHPPPPKIELTIGYASNIVDSGKCAIKRSLFPISPKARQRPAMQPAEATYSDG